MAGIWGKLQAYGMTSVCIARPWDSYGRMGGCRNIGKQGNCVLYRRSDSSSSRGVAVLDGVCVWSEDNNEVTAANADK